MGKTLLIVDNRVLIYSSIPTKKKFSNNYKFIECERLPESTMRDGKKWKSELNIHDTLDLGGVKRVNKGLPLRNLELSFAAGVGGRDR